MLTSSEEDKSSAARPLRQRAEAWTGVRHRGRVGDHADENARHVVLGKPRQHNDPEHGGVGRGSFRRERTHILNEIGRRETASSDLQREGRGSVQTEGEGNVQ
jgi:hypothetical protein